ncbi:MAG: tetratricopeptide repeat protein [Candidatus Deferrimicrobiaceae bacterium]
MEKVKVASAAGRGLRLACIVCLVIVLGISVFPAASSSADVSELVEKANKGDAEAQTALAERYQKGEGVPKNDAEAAKWYRKAAEQGVPDAQVNLGLMQANGQGGPRDYGEAVEWYRKAAEQGNEKAQHGLGVMYHNGFGVERNDAEAMEWFRKAAKQGYYGKPP